MRLFSILVSLLLVACNETPKIPANSETVNAVVTSTKVSIGGIEYNFTAKEVTNFKPDNTRKVQVFLEFAADTLVAYGVYTGEDGKTSDYEVYKIPTKEVAPDSYISKEDVEYPKATVNKFYLKAKAGHSFVQSLFSSSDGLPVTKNITETELMIMDSVSTNKVVSLLSVKE